MDMDVADGIMMHSLVMEEQQIIRDAMDQGTHLANYHRVWDEFVFTMTPMWFIIPWKPCQGMEEALLDIMYEIPSNKQIRKCVISAAVIEGDAGPELYDEVGRPIKGDDLHRHKAA